MMNWIKRQVFKKLDNWAPALFRGYLLNNEEVLEVVYELMVKRIARNTDIQMQYQALKTTTDYLIRNAFCGLKVKHREAMWRYVKEADPKGLFCEFGVFNGSSINFMAKLVQVPIHGFDSFEGIPDDWNNRTAKGAFDKQGKMPDVLDNVVLYKGWFDQTLPEFVRIHKEPVSFLHIDCDLYSSTKTVFKYLGDRIKSGTIIIFDEYFNYPGWEEHEHKAFQEFVKERSVKYEYLAYLYCGTQVAVRVKSLAAD